MVKYLGYVFSPAGLTIASNKVKTIQEWPEPRKVKNIQSFLGFANFYCCFIKDFALLSKPKTSLTKKDVPFDWCPKCGKAFEELKTQFISAPILVHYHSD